MNSQPVGLQRCTVANAEKLPAETGGEKAICAAISRAVAAQGIQSPYRVDMRVLSPSMIAASVTTADGRSLPEQKFASSDRPLNRASFERFARTLAAQLAEASGNR